MRTPDSTRIQGLNLKLLSLYLYLRSDSSPSRITTQALGDSVLTASRACIFRTPRYLLVRRRSCSASSELLNAVIRHMISYPRAEYAHLSGEGLSNLARLITLTYLEEPRDRAFSGCDAPRGSHSYRASREGVRSPEHAHFTLSSAVTVLREQTSRFEFQLPILKLLGLSFMPRRTRYACTLSGLPLSLRSLPHGPSVFQRLTSEI